MEALSWRVNKSVSISSDGYVGCVLDVVNFW